MPSKGQFTGMTGVYLVAVELSRRNLVACATSRSARGADILVSDEHCKRAFTVQVKTNASTYSFWLLNQHAKEMVADSHIYVFVNLLKGDAGPEFFVVPSKIVKERMCIDNCREGKSVWYSIYKKQIMNFKDRWDIFNESERDDTSNEQIFPEGDAHE